MLGADVIVKQSIRFLRGVPQYPLCLRTERQFDRGRKALAVLSASFDLFHDIVDRQLRARDHLRYDRAARAEDSDKDMLGFDRSGTELARLVPREEEGPPRALGVSLEHRRPFYTGGRNAATVRGADRGASTAVETASSVAIVRYRSSSTAAC